MKTPSQKSLSRTALNMADHPNKKSIAESSPYKRKMSQYLNTSDEPNPRANEKYSQYKKRTGYF